MPISRLILPGPDYARTVDSTHDGAAPSASLPVANWGASEPRSLGTCELPCLQARMVESHLMRDYDIMASGD